MVEELLRGLGYDEEPNFLRGGAGELEAAPAYGHVFRRAARELGLKGVYVLRSVERSPREPLVPVVYVCEVQSEKEAAEVHRLVWNQDVVPFLLVSSPSSVRLYSGFNHPRRTGRVGQAEAVLRVLRNLNDVSELAREGFHADRINDGTLWRTWGAKVRSEERVDWRLLDNLRRLDKWLQDEADLERDVSHALIGKYVYLHYLKDRRILSDEKLRRWGISKEQVFGRNVTVEALEAVTQRLDTWLNGSVFPLRLQGRGAPKLEHLRRVAATFQGDELQEDGSWQLHLDFKAYDFSYIPIETLSVIYQQFLHSPQGQGKQEGGRQKHASSGREAGAYYTPIPVVNFMLAELQDQRPLERGMRVLDPSCGSGAFLVQCYRQLIERELIASGAPPRPTELRELLKQSIFGVDQDADACGVTEFSLLVVMLDYIDSPDLENGTRFQLPTLRDENIFCEDFFQANSEKLALLRRKRFDWIVGNPPWKQLKSEHAGKEDENAWKWIQASAQQDMPVADNQVAQAFAWEVGCYLAPRGEVALLLPAMTLFEEPSKRFRAEFFRKHRVHSIANFSNLAEVLFAGRSRVPAAALFYSVRHPAGSLEDAAGESIAMYSPFLANQESTRPVQQGRRGGTWSLVLNASEVREVAAEEAWSGSGLAWKFAVWGSHLDRRLLGRLEREFPSLQGLEEQGYLKTSQGLELREAPSSREEEEKSEPIPEVAGKDMLDVKALEALRHIFSFPRSAIIKVAPELTHVRKGRGRLPLSVCRPPHVVVSAARNFAVYDERLLIIPPRQIGIISPTGDQALLKAIALYLNSDLASYHQFFTSTELGVKRPRATLAALRRLPMPFRQPARADLARWVELHEQLIAAEPPHEADEQGPLFSTPRSGRGEFDRLLGELNTLVYETFRMSRLERVLVEDLVRVRRELDDGRLGQTAVRPPSEPELERYGRRLKSELDAFIIGALEKRHEVAIIHDGTSGMVQVELVLRERAARGAKVMRADSQVAMEMRAARRNLQQQFSQWVYFNRNLRVFEGTKTFILKPMQRFHWTESQAMLDAAEIIADSLEGSGDSP